MTPDNKAEKSQSKEGNQSSSDRKTSTVRRQEQVINCPRCNSPNTKFCYYNNYSLSQPRHFCKTCRRYWTKGGALRSVPIGGGCRKNKKIKSSSKDYSSATSSSDIGGFNFFQGFSPAMDFPKLNSSTTNSIFNENSSFGGISTSGSSPCFNLEHSAGSLMGFNLYLSKSLLKQGGVRGMGSVNDTGNLASSIESLSSINQDLHWKLQQQRLANMLFGGEDQKDSNVSSVPLGNIQKPQPILFQNLENFNPETAFGNNTSRKENSGSGNFATEWFFDNSFTSVNPTPTNSSNGNANENSNSWNDIQAWGNLNQYSTVLP